jgi:trafficking protein particle complex subunit 9
MRPQKIHVAKVDTGPFIFTPPSFGSLDRDKGTLSKKGQTKLGKFQIPPKYKFNFKLHFTDFLWVEGDVCEVQVTLENHLPIELKVVDMVSPFFCYILIQLI